MTTRIKQFRTSAGLRQVDFARIVGIRQAHLSDIENAVLPVGLRRAARIAEAMGAPIESIFTPTGYARYEYDARP